MDEIGRRKEMFGKEIRKTMRRSIINERRANLLQHQDVNELFVKFVDERKSEIPSQCVEYFEAICNYNLTYFLQVTERLKMQYEASEIPSQDSNLEHHNKSVWFFDSTEPGNIRFATLLGQQTDNFHSSFFQDFFAATVRANEKYVNFKASFEYHVSNTHCFIMSKSIRPISKMNQEKINEESEFQNQILKLEKLSDYQMQQILSYLEHWSLYLNKMDDWFAISQFQNIILCFLCWIQHSDIHLRRETYRFIYSILKHIIISKILLFYKTEQLMKLKDICNQFINRLKIILPYQYSRLDFPEITYILCEIFHDSQHFPGLFYEITFDPIRVKNYLFRLLNTNYQDMNSLQDYEKIRAGLRLFYFILESYNPAKIITLDGIRSALQVSCKLALIPVYQRDALLTIYNTIIEDQDRYYLDIIKKINFHSLAQSISPNNKEHYYELLIRIPFQYRDEDLLHDILSSCSLEEQVRIYCQEIDNNQLYLNFIDVIDRYKQYFTKCQPLLSVQVLTYAKDELQFNGKQQFIKDMKKHIELTEMEGSHSMI